MSDETLVPGTVISYRVWKLRHREFSPYLNDYELLSLNQTGLNWTWDTLWKESQCKVVEKLVLNINQLEDLMERGQIEPDSRSWFWHLPSPVVPGPVTSGRRGRSQSIFTMPNMLATEEWIDAAKQTINNHDFMNCVCGFYSSPSIATISKQVGGGGQSDYLGSIHFRDGSIRQGDIEDNIGPRYVIGVVESKGKISVGPRGLRSQQSRILALVNSSAIGGFNFPHENTDIAIVDKFSDLVKEFPPTDIRELIGVTADDPCAKHECSTCGGCAVSSGARWNALVYQLTQIRHHDVTLDPCICIENMLFITKEIQEKTVREIKDALERMNENMLAGFTSLRTMVMKLKERKVI